MDTNEGRLAELRARYEQEQGEWNETWERVMRADPEFFSTYLDLAGAPGKSGVLEPKIQELVHIAVASAATHLHEEGTRTHIRRALERGASREEIVEVLELTATLGIHATNCGTPVLLAAYRDAGREPDWGELSERQLQLKARFENERGYWYEFWNDVLNLDPNFFEAYLDLSSHPWRNGVLSPKVKEIIYIAFDASATHMFLPGLRLHIDNALGYGATLEEIMAVFEIASGLGMRALTLAVPILDEELERLRSLEVSADAS